MLISEKQTHIHGNGTVHDIDNVPRDFARYTSNAVTGEGKDGINEIDV